MGNVSLITLFRIVGEYEHSMYPVLRRVRAWDVQHAAEGGGTGGAGTRLPRHPRARLLGRYHPGGEGRHTPQGG